MMSVLSGAFSRTVSRPEEPKNTPSSAPAVNKSDPGMPGQGALSADGTSSYTIKHYEGIPDIEYPSPLVVKNTFIDGPNQPTSFMDFYQERKLQSCPNSGIMGTGGSPDKADDDKSSTRGSTSVGGSSPSSSVVEEDREMKARNAGISGNIKVPQLPELGDHSPPAVSIKNTFIHAGVKNTADGFFKEREIQSCPASGIGAPPGLELQDDESPRDRKERRPSTTSSDMLLAAATAAAQCLRDSEDDDSIFTTGEHSVFTTIDSAPPASPSTQESQQPVVGNRMPPPPSAPPALGAVLARPALDMLPPPPSVAAPAFDAFGEAPPSPPQFAAMSRGAAMAPILSLEEAIAVPAPGMLGSPECPTIGSQEHHLGTCKPCAYAHSKGCGNGAQCPFCHLCPVGELKRRQKEKRANQRMMRGMAAGMGAYDEGVY